MLLAAVSISATWPGVSAAAWPVWPTNEQHPVRGGFGDPRWNGRSWQLHAGVDVAVDERTQPTQQVYSLVAARVTAVTVTPKNPCGSVTIGRVQLGHVSSPLVRVGQRVEVGQLVGLTCPTLWHVHVVERDRTGRLVNPLRPGGILTPYEDTAPPAIGPIVVDGGGVRARIGDPQSFRGWFDEVPELYDDHPPRLIQVDGRTVVSLGRLGRVSGVRYSDVYSDWTRRNLTAQRCLGTLGGPCGGELWFRLGQLSVWDLAGNLTTTRFAVGRLDPPGWSGGG